MGGVPILIGPLSVTPLLTRELLQKTQNTTEIRHQLFLVQASQGRCVHKKHKKNSAFLQDFLNGEKVKQGASFVIHPFLKGQALFDPRCFDRFIEGPKFSIRRVTRETFQSSRISRSDLDRSRYAGDAVRARMQGPECKAA